MLPGATVGAIVARVGEAARARTDCSPGLRRIGIDEVSYRRGHRCLTVVVDHDTGRLVWAAPGLDQKTLEARSDRDHHGLGLLVEGHVLDDGPFQAEQLGPRSR